VRIEVDSARDLLYIWLGELGQKAAETRTVAPGVHVDFDAEGGVVGIEVLADRKAIRYEPSRTTAR